MFEWNKQGSLRVSVADPNPDPYDPLDLSDPNPLVRYMAPDPDYYSIIKQK